MRITQRSSIRPPLGDSNLKRPRLDEFNDDGAIEQDADVIIFLHREDYYLLQEEPSPESYEHMNWVSQVELAWGRAEMIIAKQRNGVTGSVAVTFNPGIGSFADLSFDLP